MNNEYMRVVEVYFKVIDELLYKDSSTSSHLCAWSKNNTLANFKSMAFKVVLKQHEGLDNYRYYLRIFRTFNWIVCKSEKFTNVQWINGKSVRVISVDYEIYKLLKKLISEKYYVSILKKHIKVVDKIIHYNEKTEKSLCYWSKEEKILNVKSENYRYLLQKECEEINECKQNLKYFRKMGFIICQSGNFSNVQWLEGKSVRVISIDYEIYKLIKELLLG